MKISFILPAYKRRFLKEAIASILAQTFRDFELVVVDDCSPENLKEVVDEFTDSRLTYVRHDENLGGKSLVSAWNYAMTFATGEWCVLASDDDVYLPRYAEEMLALVARYPAVDLAHARLARINAEGTWTNVSDERLAFESEVRFAFSRAALGLAQAAPDFMFRRAAYEKLGGFVDFPLAWYSDDATWFSLAANGVACSAEILFLFRNSGLNISSRFDNIRTKLTAGEQYRSWFARRVDGMTAKTDEDVYLLGRLKAAVDERISELSFEELEPLSFGAWRKCLSALPKSLRREAVYRRFPKLRTLRKLLPF